MRPNILFAVIWIGWLVSWLGASFWSSPVQKRAVTWHTWVYRVALLAGAVLLVHSTRRLLHEPRLWHVGYDGAYALAGVSLAGLLLAWWARIYLGPLWSGSVVRKEGHHVVDTGPYAWVRHPIYSGLMLAIVATAAAQGTISGYLGAACIVIGFWLKARIEERLLSAELGADAYGAYRRRVPMLVPFLPGG
jgi:protein-S-isoprenylcysteine O-methyltransferase Ste14